MRWHGELSAPVQAAAVEVRLGPDNAQHATGPAWLCWVIITPYPCTCLHIHTIYCSFFMESKVLAEFLIFSCL